MKRLMVLLFSITTMAFLSNGCSSGELTVTEVRVRPVVVGQNGAVYFVIDKKDRAG